MAGGDRRRPVEQRLPHWLDSERSLHSCTVSNVCTEYRRLLILHSRLLRLGDCSRRNIRKPAHRTLSQSEGDMREVLVLGGALQIQRSVTLFAKGRRSRRHSNQPLHSQSRSVVFAFDSLFPRKVQHDISGVFNL